MATHVSEINGRTKERSSFEELTEIAQRIQAFTNGSGAAIGLRLGDTNDMICCARSGPSAREVGSTIGVAGSFTGLCIQTGKGLLCDDTETDPRVDPETVRALGIRSMVVTPIKEESLVIGVLAVFSPFAHAFTGVHLAVIKTTADQILVLLQKERRAREGGVDPSAGLPAAKPMASANGPATPAQVVEPALPKTPVEATSPAPAVIKPAIPVPAEFPVVKPIVPAVASESPLPMSPTPLIARPAASAPSPVVAKPVPAVPAPSPQSVAPEVPKPVREVPRRLVENSSAFWSGSGSSAPTHEPVAPSARMQTAVPTPLAEDIVPSISLPEREESAWKQRRNRTSFGTLDSVAAAQKKSPSKLIIAGIAAVLLVAVGSVIAFRKFHQAPSSAAVHTQEPPVASAPVPHAQETSNPATTPQTSVASTDKTGIAPASSPQPGTAAPVARNSVPSAPAQNNTADTSGKTDRTQVKASTPSQPEKRAPETVALVSGPSKITSSGTEGGTPPDATPAPALTVGGNAALGKLSPMPTADVSDKPAVKIQSALQPVEVSKRVAPVYPAIAKTRGIRGDVLVQVQVGTDGKASGMQLISGPPIFRDAAFEAIKQWQFKPAMLNGQPIEQKTQIRLKFGD